MNFVVKIYKPKPKSKYTTLDLLPFDSLVDAFNFAEDHCEKYEIAIKRFDNSYKVLVNIGNNHG